MTHAHTIPAHRRDQRGHWALEAFLLMAMTLVAVAVGAGLYLQFAVLPGLSIAAALCIYIALVSGHILIRRSETVVALRAEVEQLEGELIKLKRSVAGRQGGPPSEKQPGLAELRKPAKPGGPRKPFPKAMPIEAFPPSPDTVTQAPAGPPAGAAGVPPFSAASDHSSPRLPMPELSADAGFGASRPPAPSTGRDRVQARAPAHQPAPPLPAAIAMPDASQPRPMAAPPPGPASAGQGAPPAAEPGRGAQSRGSASTVASDVDAINGIIKRLAEEMGELPESGGPPSAAGARGLADPSSVPGSEASISTSVDALNAAAAKMRRSDASTGIGAPGGSSRPPLLPAGPASPSPSPERAGGAHGRMTEIAGAIAAKRFDAFLEPILGLPDRRARHYEFSIRIRTGRNESVTREDYLAMARGTGMLPLLDSIRLSRLAKVAGYMVERGSSGSLFVSVSGESLANEDFVATLAEVYPKGSPLPERITLSFAQSDMRGFGPQQWASLKRLSEAGFRLAVEDVVALEGLATLKSAGFAFAKLKVRRLVEGLPGAKGVLAPPEAVRALTEAGLSVIAAQVEADIEVASAADLGVPLVQGPMFGGPRPVKTEVVESSGGVAA